MHLSEAAVSQQSMTTVATMTDAALAPEPRGSLKVTAFGITDKGRVRADNEDQFLVAELAKSMRVWQTSLPEPRVQIGDERAHLFLVADGMGGHLAGERASALAAVAIEQFTLNTFKWFLGADSAETRKALEQFQLALRQADVHILAEAEDHPELSGMGTAVTMAFHVGRHLCVVHVGGGRAYVYRDGELHQLTRDHTVTADLVRSGAIRPDQAAGHRLRHVVTNVVGGTEAGVDVEAHALEVQAGDRLLLCSDGLTDMVTDGAIAATLEAEGEPAGAVRRLLAQADAAGAPDNVTLIVARFEAGNADAASA